MSKCDSAGQHGDRMNVAVIYGGFLCIFFAVLSSVIC